jgi:hypothetical protein
MTLSEWNFEHLRPRVKRSRPRGPATPRTSQGTSPPSIPRGKARREPLTGMAYFCLTVLQGGSGKKARRQTATKYGFDITVLNNLGRLACTAGDDHTARKKDPGNRPLTPSEIEWMETVIRAMIQRTGQWCHDPQRQWPLLSMKDFPSLNP